MAQSSLPRLKKSVKYSDKGDTPSNSALPRTRQGCRPRQRTRRAARRNMMAQILTSDITNVQRSVARSAAAAAARASVRQPVQHLVEEVAQIRPSAKATGQDPDNNVIRTHPPAAAVDMLASMEQASERTRHTKAKPGPTQTESGTNEPRAASENRQRRGPYQGDPPRSRKIDLIA